MGWDVKYGLGWGYEPVGRLHVLALIPGSGRVRSRCIARRLGSNAPSSPTSKLHPAGDHPLRIMIRSVSEGAIGIAMLSQDMQSNRTEKT